MSPRVPESSEALARAVSRLLGWVYMLSWSASFYPQPLLNWRRSSTVGVSIDFPAINIIGFTCYTISTASFLYSPVIREQYAARHTASKTPTVRLNDLAFGVHGVILTLLTYSQFFSSLWGFQVPKSQRVSRPIAGIIWGSITAIVIVVLVVAVRSGREQQNPLNWAWIDVVYTIGYVKLVVTLVKYIPQAWLNYQRKSTSGWSIWQILFDVTGGVLSLLQLVIDSLLQGNWEGLAANPVKLGLSNISIFFDLIFITQHYILYRKTGDDDKLAEESNGAAEPLLHES